MQVRRLARRTVAALAVLALCPAIALAQRPKAKTPPKPPDRGAIYVNGAYQGSTDDVTSTVAFTANLETGTFTSKFRVKPGAAFDAGGRVRVWKRLGFGVGITTFGVNRDTDISGQVPHPFFFKTFRAISGTAPGEHKETTIHLRLVVTSPFNRRWQFSAFAGPAFFTVAQTLVDKVSYTDTYPFDTATFTSATTRRASKSKTGFGGGGDAAFFFTRNLGVGVSASIARTSFNLKASDDSAVSMHAGGAIAALGVRIRF